MGVAQSIRRGFGVGLPVPETNFEKLGPMKYRAKMSGRGAEGGESAGTGVWAASP